MLDTEGYRHTQTHSQYATLIAFPKQQRLHERASMLRYAYIACLVIVVSIVVALANRKVFSVAMEMHCTVVQLHKILYLC
jgi:hypothetical protein